MTNIYGRIRTKHEYNILSDPFIFNFNEEIYNDLRTGTLQLEPLTDITLRHTDIYRISDIHNFQLSQYLHKKF